MSENIFYYTMNSQQENGEEYSVFYDVIAVMSLYTTEYGSRDR